VYSASSIGLREQRLCQFQFVKLYPPARPMAWPVLQRAACVWRRLCAPRPAGFASWPLSYRLRDVANTANGISALSRNIRGNFNIADGYHALFNNTTGSNNTALGVGAGVNLTTGNNNIDIGAGVGGVAGESNVTRIRNIGSTAQANGIFVTVGAGGKLGFQVSSRRYKDNIKPMDKASEALFALKPVSFRYKQEIDPARSPDFGLIAEDVATVNPDLVARDEEGKIVTVRYQAVNAMLLNEFLKEHGQVQELKGTVAQQQEQIRALTASLKEQASQIQKVSAALEVSKPAPQTVLNNQ
jgi:Chaperone of endosialidase